MTSQKTGTDKVVREGNSYRMERIKRISQSFFLHIHSTRVHISSLRPTYTFGLGIILGFLFLILILTGVVLMMYYTPSVERAYDSVKDIVYIVPGGRYIRNIHRWASHGMVLIVFLHLARVFYTGSYMHSRKLNWIIGVCMLVITLFLSFSGYLLPWDQLAYWAVTIGSNIAASARELTDLLGITNYIDIGGFMKKLLIGEETVGQPALSRFFTLHVIFLPLSLLVLIAVHFWRIRKDGGLSCADFREGVNRESDEEKNKIYTWPVVMWAELAILFVISAVLLLTAFIVDAPLLEKANPAFPENPAKSPWYFLGIQELVSYSAFSGGLLIPLLYLGFLISIPYIDKQDHYQGRWFAGKTGMRTALYSLVMSLVVVIGQLFVMVRYGWLRDWFPGISQGVVMLVNPATLSVIGFVLWAGWIRRKTNSTRMASIALFTASLVAIVIFTAMGIWFRGPNWDFFWSRSQWPVI
ncbi:MAG: cytochrome b N-terminal domain-containing protein [Bacteroidales bacterium]|nr:MAG: cytochrome b N-terminal domain-containing protein [Bacteroidales bacterium]